jgi:hypothetical protein
MMPETDTPPGFPFLHSGWRPVLTIVMVGIAAFIFWTLPDWHEFWSNAAQFPALWQISSNRIIILDLVMKILSPFLLMTMTGIILWIYHLLNASQNGGVSNHDQHGQEKKSDQPASFMSGQALQAETPTSSTGPAVAPSEHNPENPLPSTHPISVELRGQTEESKISSVPSEEAVPTVERRKENTSAEINPVQIPGIQKTDGPWDNGQASEASPLISIWLLKDVSMMINAPDGRHIVVPLTLNAKRVQLLAYIAWRRGELIDRDKILEHVFGWGLSDEEATEDKLSERFESHKKLLRKKIREVVAEQINKPAGREVIRPDIDPFISNSGFWGLSDICRVDDLEIVESCYKVIALARKDGKLIEEIPEYVKEACERLIANYPGDFLASLIKKYPSEFRPWQGRSSWTRKPFTHYRDFYLDALWYAAEYD